MMGSKAFESPLISHIRMRALFRALVETRVLASHPLLSRNRKSIAFPRNLEAAFVATAIDLHDGDLTFAEPSTALFSHIRALALRPSAGNATRPEIRRTLQSLDPSNPLPASLPAIDRLLVACGAATALKPARKVVIAYASQPDLSSPDWKRVLAVAAEGDLPLILVTLPHPAARPAPSTRAVPVIPVDVGDVVALYRVAQESIGRARAEGGTVVIHCIPCGVDPIKLLATQLVTKKICTDRWIAEVEPQFRASLAALPTAPHPPASAR